MKWADRRSDARILARIGFYREHGYKQRPDDRWVKQEARRIRRAWKRGEAA